MCTIAWGSETGPSALVPSKSTIYADFGKIGELECCVWFKGELRVERWYRERA